MLTMIDTHCHIDLHDDPIGIARRIEESQIECVAVTMLPSHYRMALPHIKKFDQLHASLGMHPLRITEGVKETEAFMAFSQSCDFIGEVGLDFSREGNATRETQISVLKKILDSLRGGKFVSVHSRGAALETLAIFDDGNVGPVCFHYFTGGLEVATAAANKGHYFSFNCRMLNGRNKGLLDSIPKDRVLVESEGMSRPLLKL